MADLQHAISLVEAVLTDLGVDPQDARDTGDDDHAEMWGLQNGSAHVFIRLEAATGDEEEQETVLQVFSPILKLTTEAPPTELLLRLLTLNAQLVTAGFCIVEDEVSLLTGRVCEGLDKSEVHEMVVDVAGLADHYDNVLSEEFGLEMYGSD